MKTILLTGAGGFIGHHCVEYWLQKTDWHIICLDSFKHKGTYSRLDEITGWDRRRITIYPHDLHAPIDFALFSKIGNVHYIVNMASNSAVERSIHDSRECWENNCAIAINVLDLARRLMDKGLERCLHVSTDEVYGDYDGDGAGHRENAPPRPSNPYSASKAAQEALAYSYWRTFNLPIIVTNAANNYGERQDPEKFIPRLIGKIWREEEIPIYTDPAGAIGSRYYLHCKDHADAILTLLQSAPDEGEMPKYNICSDDELDNLEVAEMAASMVGKSLKHKLIYPETERPGYDKRYHIDWSKLRNLGWRPNYNFATGLRETTEWTLNNQHWMGTN